MKDRLVFHPYWLNEMKITSQLIANWNRRRMLLNLSGGLLCLKQDFLRILECPFQSQFATWPFHLSSDLRESKLIYFYKFSLFLGCINKSVSSSIFWFLRVIKREEESFLSFDIAVQCQLSFKDTTVNFKSSLSSLSASWILWISINFSFQSFQVSFSNWLQLMWKVW